MVTIPPFSTVTNDQTGFSLTNKTAEPWAIESLSVEGEIVRNTAPHRASPPPPSPAPAWIPIPPPARPGFKFSKPIPEGSPSKTVRFFVDDNGKVIGAEVFEVAKTAADSTKP